MHLQQQGETAGQYQEGVKGRKCKAKKMCGKVGDNITHGDIIKTRWG